jgi:actin-related protein 6
MTSYSVTIKMVLFFFVTLVGALSCRPEGPILPAGMRVNASHYFLSARASLDEALEHAILKEIAPGWAVENTSFSLAVVSMSQVDPGKPLWEFHHRAKENTKGTNSVDRDSQYLIGSVTKVLADLALIRSELKLDKPITAYLPELQCMSNSSGIPWNDITLRMLASHMAGIPSDCGCLYKPISTLANKNKMDFLKNTISKICFSPTDSQQSMTPHILLAECSP